MQVNSGFPGAFGRTSLLLNLAALLFTGLANAAPAAGYTNLPVVKPIKSCADLTGTDLSKVADTPGKVRSAEATNTDKGQFCKVVAEVEPQIVITVFLPAEHWTQRLVMNGAGGGAPGPNGYVQAGSCAPALNGDFAVVGNNLGHFDSSSRQALLTVAGWDWARDPQKRIDWGYRANHVTVLVSRVLMKAYYGQAPRYSYFIGCSEGGREALIEAQRYPDDFDGVSAGAPAALQTGNETTFHLWIVQANRRADDTNLLMPEKRKLVHDAVLAQCDTLSGVRDGLLQDPTACHFNPASLQCPSGSMSTSGCLTAEEVTAFQKLYDGATDERGNHLLFGLERGGEAQWLLANTPTADPPRAQLAAMQRAFVILPEVTPAARDYSHLEFTRAGFDLGETLSPLYDGLNTNLKSFAARGGKLILWHGLTDFLIPPKVSLAYYQGVQKFMGTASTDRFLRLFLLPGVGHCGGGDGYDQLDVLSPLMAWTESKQAPTDIMAGMRAERRIQGPAENPADGVPRPSAPYATPLPTLGATRPVYPYPYIARYSGKGDSRDGANYSRATSPAAAAPLFASDYAVLKLIAPDNQRDYSVKDGRLVVTDAPRGSRSAK
jgi:feruloyl esterase